MSVCGCRIEPAWTHKDTTLPVDTQVIHFCPLHAAAPALLEKAQYAIKLQDRDDIDPEIADWIDSHLAGLIEAIVYAKGTKDRGKR